MCLEIPERTKIGKGIQLFHGQGLVIYPNVVIGSNSIIIGSICIGNNVTIGAGSLVLKDVPNNAVVVGSSAKIIRIKNKDD